MLPTQLNHFHFHMSNIPRRSKKKQPDTRFREDMAHPLFAVIAQAQMVGLASLRSRASGGIG